MWEKTHTDKHKQADDGNCSLGVTHTYSHTHTHTHTRARARALSLSLSHTHTVTHTVTHTHTHTHNDNNKQLRYSASIARLQLTAGRAVRFFAPVGTCTDPQGTVTREAQTHTIERAEQVHTDCRSFLS